jgi:hypothetical protein
VYWLQSPPYLKRLGAFLLILAAIAWDLRASAVEPFPTATGLIAAGTPITDELITWVDLPQGRLPRPDLANATAARDIAAGELLTSPALAGPFSAPAGWWTVSIEIGALATPGDEVLLVVDDPPISTTGFVITPQFGDPYTMAYRPAAVAVAPDLAPLVAAAQRSDRLITAVRSTPGQS